MNSEMCDEISCICGRDWKYVELCQSCKEKKFCKSCGVITESMGIICSDCFYIVSGFGPEPITNSEPDSCICGDNWKYTILCPNCKSKAYCKSCRVDREHKESICSECFEKIRLYTTVDV